MSGGTNSAPGIQFLLLQTGKTYINYQICKLNSRLSAYQCRHAALQIKDTAALHNVPKLHTGWQYFYRQNAVLITTIVTKNVKSQYRVKAKSKVLPCAKEPAKTKQQQTKADTCIHQHIKQNILKCFPHPIWRGCQTTNINSCRWLFIC